MSDNDVVFPVPVPGPDAPSYDVNAIKRAISLVNSVVGSIVKLTPTAIDDAVVSILQQLDTSESFAHLIGHVAGLSPDDQAKLVQTIRQPS